MTSAIRGWRTSWGISDYSPKALTPPAAQRQRSRRSIVADSNVSWTYLCAMHTTTCAQLAPDRRLHVSPTVLSPRQHRSDVTREGLYSVVGTVHILRLALELSEPSLTRISGQSTFAVLATRQSDTFIPFIMDAIELSAVHTRPPHALAQESPAISRSATTGDDALTKQHTTIQTVSRENSQSAAPSTAVSATTPASRRLARFQFATLCWTLFLAGWNDGTTGPLLDRIQHVYHVCLRRIS